jgi:hypothetical protein
LRVDIGWGAEGPKAVFFPPEGGKKIAAGELIATSKSQPV